MDNKKLSMLCDFYELKMACGYVKSGVCGKNAHFDLFFRKIPDNGGYAVFAGLEQVCEFIENLSFDTDDIDFIREKGLGDRDFTEYLRNFRFSGSIYSVPEGSVVFPNEPVLTVQAPAGEAQLIETQLLFLVNHQSLIATKASRMAHAAGSTPIIEMGSRRAHGADAALYGARAAYIGGCEATTCTLAAQRFGIPLKGTMAHSWVQMFDSEYDAFIKFIELYPEDAVLLLDTYDTVSSGLENAVKAISHAERYKNANVSVRLDSGDIGHLSRQVRDRLDAAGLSRCRIIASNSLDEYKIRALTDAKSPIDAFGAGENLITSKSSPIFTGVYKLTALEDGGVMTPKIKLSENYSKITTPGVKKVHRFYDKRDGKALADEICTEDEMPPAGKHTIFDPDSTWKAKTLTDYSVREMLVPVYVDGVRVYDTPNIESIRKYRQGEVDSLCESLKKLDYPEKYYVDFSEKLWTLKRRMTGQRRSGFFLR